MALPPDPHDDDLAEPPASPPPPPPAPAAEAGGQPAAPAATEPDQAPVEPTESLPTTAPAPPAAATATPPAPAGPAAGSSPPPASNGGGRGRLGLTLAGVVAVIVIAGGVVLATGSGDDTPAPTADADEVGDPAPDGGGKGDATGGADDDDTSGDSAPGDDAAADGPSAGGDAEASTSDETPVEAAEEFFAAVDAQDCAGIVGRMTPESYGREGQTADEAIVECQADVAGTAMASSADYEDVDLVSEDGDEATVSVTVTMGAQENERDMPMRLVDGRWLMHLDTSLVAPAG